MEKITHFKAPVIAWEVWTTHDIQLDTTDSWWVPVLMSGDGTQGLPQSQMLEFAQFDLKYKGKRQYDRVQLDHVVPAQPGTFAIYCQNRQSASIVRIEHSGAPFVDMEDTECEDCYRDVVAAFSVEQEKERK